MKLSRSGIRSRTSRQGRACQPPAGSLTVSSRSTRQSRAGSGLGRQKLRVAERSRDVLCSKVAGRVHPCHAGYERSERRCRLRHRRRHAIGARNAEGPATAVRHFGRIPETRLELAAIAARLFDAEGFDGIVRDSGKVSLGKREKAILSHSVRDNVAPPRSTRPSPSCRSRRLPVPP